MQKKVLFVGHSSLRTGAPLILLNFLTWFKNNSSIPFRMLLKDSGELENEYQMLAPVNVFKNKKLPSHRLLRRMPFIPKLQTYFDQHHFSKLRKALDCENIGLVYSNTIMNGEVLEFLSSLKCPVISHVHELDYWIEKAGPKNMNQVRQYTQQYIVVSEAVKRNLVINHNISEELIEIVYGFVPTSDLIRNAGVRGNLRRALNVPDNACIVGSSGYDTWLKGKDLFVQLALNVVKKYRDRPVHFVWIGGRMDDEEFSRIQYDMVRSGVGNNIHFISHVPDPLNYFIDFDLFAMISREDSFPLVILEAATLGKPVVCFDNAGGTPEFVRNDAGFVVPYLDISAMADKIIALAEDDGLRKIMGQSGFNRVKKHHDIAIGAAKIQNAIERYF